MNLPKVVAELVNTQNSFDSVGYANCFSETALVFDEGKTHKGRKEIERWIADANERYKATMKPLSFKQNGTKSIFEAEVSGDFKGSPLVMSYHLEIADHQIQSLRITA